MASGFSFNYKAFEAEEMNELRHVATIYAKRTLRWIGENF